MEIFYCSNCHGRVSSVDIEQGRGLKSNNKPFCQDCVKKLNLQAPAAAPASTKYRVRKASDVKRPASAPSRRPASERRVAAAPAPAPAAPASNMAPIIAILAVVVLGLVGLLIFLLMRKPPVLPPKPQPPVPPVISDTPPPAQPDAPVTDKRAVPDKPGPLPVQPDKPAVVIAAAGIPAFPGSSFPADWKSLIGPDWNKTWDPGRTPWEFKDNLLTAFLDPEKGSGMLKSFPEWGNFKIGLSFATNVPCMVDIRFRDEGNNYGRYTVPQTTAGTWHALMFRVKGDKIEKAEFDGQDVTRAFNTGKMKMQGRISLAIRPARFEPCTVSFGAIRVKELPYEVSGDARELVKNSSFRQTGEKIFADWDFWGKWENGVYTMHRVPGRDDDACAELRCQTQGRGGIYQKLEARTGEKVLATIWYRTEKADSGRIFMNFESPGQDGWKSRDLVGGTHGWQKAVLEATIPFDKNGRPMPYFSIYIYNASNGSLFIDDVSVRVVGGMGVADTAPAEAGEGWTDLLPADNLAASGWSYSHDNDSYKENFSIQNGTLIKPIRTAHCKVDRKVDFNKGEIRFDYEQEGDYWQINVMSQGNFGLVFSVSARGKHSIRILLTETGATVFWDGKVLEPNNSDIRISAKLEKPINRPSTIRFYVSDKTGIRISNFRYRQSE